MIDGIDLDNEGSEEASQNAGSTKREVHTSGVEVCVKSKGSNQCHCNRLKPDPPVRDVIHLGTDEE